MRNRKLFLICLPLLFLASFCLPSIVSAAELECGGVDTIILSCEGEAEDSIFEILQLVVDIMSIGVGILAVIGITITGIQWTTSGGNEQTATKAKRRFFEILVGVAIYVTARILDQVATTQQPPPAQIRPALVRAVVIVITQLQTTTIAVHPQTTTDAILVPRVGQNIWVYP